jgi:hypothetical protein
MRERLDPIISTVLESDSGKDLVDFSLRNSAAEACDNLKISAGRKVQIEIRTFDESSDTRESFMTIAGEGFAKQFDPARRRGHKGQRHSNGGTFSCSVGTEEPEDFARAHGEFQVPDRPAFPVPFPESDCPEDWCVSHSAI